MQRRTARIAALVMALTGLTGVGFVAAHGAVGGAGDEPVLPSDPSTSVVDNSVPDAPADSVPAPDAPAPDAPVGDAVAAALPPPTRAIHFPVLGPVNYHDDFGDCRDGCSRFHQGTDLIGEKMQPLVAAVDGTITHIWADTGKHGVGIEVTDADGWTYTYFHINNDVPGDVALETPEAVDQAKARWHMPPSIAEGATVTAGQVIGWMGNSGNAENSVPHLHFEIRDPDNHPIDPYPSLLLSEWHGRCALVFLGPDARPTPVLSPPEVVADTVHQFLTSTGNGLFTVSVAGGVLVEGDAITIGNPNRATDACDGTGPELTANVLPGAVEELRTEPAPTSPESITPAPNSPAVTTTPATDPAAPVNTAAPATSALPADVEAPRDVTVTPVP